MKVVQYEMIEEVNVGTEENPKIEQFESRKTLPYSDTAIQIAKEEAGEGNYRVFDDGLPDPPPTTEERLEAQVTYTAMMTDTLLETEE